VIAAVLYQGMVKGRLSLPEDNEPTGSVTLPQAGIKGPSRGTAPTGGSDSGLQKSALRIALPWIDPTLFAGVSRPYLAKPTALMNTRF